MNLINRQIASVIFLLTLSLNAFSSNSTVKVALGEWPPYTSESLPHGGLLPHILTRALSFSAITPQFHFMSWEDAYTKTMQGKYSLSPGWLITPERKRIMHFSEPMSYIDLRFVHSTKKNFSWEKLEDIQNLKIGIVLGYSYGKELDQLIVDGKIKTTDYLSEKEALTGLANDEIDIYAADAIVAEAIINQLPTALQKRLSIDEKTITQNPIFVISSRRTSSSLIQKFNEGLTRLKSQGEYKKILENFNIVNQIHALKFYTEDNAPLNYRGHKKAEGIMVEVVEAMLGNIGADIGKINIEILPWARAYLSLEQNTKTALFAVTKTKQRSEHFKWVGPIYRSNIILLGRTNMFTGTNALSTLTKHSVCSVKEDVSEKLWKDHMPDADKLFLVSHPKQCAKMLALGRVDLWATGQDTSRWQLQDIGSDPKNFIEVNQLKESHRYIAFSKDVDESIINAFQQSLNFLKLSGELNDVISKALKKADMFATQKH